MTQLFHRGDLVKLKDEFPPWKSHFTKGCYAVILGSYDDQYGGGEKGRHQFSVWLLNEDGSFKPYGRCSWYDDEDIEYLVEERTAEILLRMEEAYDLEKA